jgi:DNA-binding transcriptional MerR regulator
MFRISEFSRLTRVSVKMLRHYDQLGLLKPSYTDAQNGYRFYTIAQLPRLHRLIALKDLGFSLDQVASLLADDLSTITLQAMLQQREAELVATIATEQQRLTQVRQNLQQLSQESPQTPYAIVLRNVPAQLAACAYTIVPELDDAVTALFDKVETYVAQHRARATAPPSLIYHDREYREQQATVEVVIPLRKAIPASAAITVGELTGGLMACVLYRGSYAQLHQAIAALLQWAAISHHQINGPVREVYLQFGATHAREWGLPLAFLTNQVDSFVTEVQLPVLPPISSTNFSPS